MAKTKESSPTDWTIEELVGLIDEQSKSLIETQGRVSTLEGREKTDREKITALESELAAVAPGRSTIPVEMFTGITAQEVFKHALIGSVVAHLSNASQASVQNQGYRNSLADRAIDFAELVFNRACERYGGKK